MPRDDPGGRRRPRCDTEPPAAAAAAVIFWTKMPTVRKIANPDATTNDGRRTTNERPVVSPLATDTLPLVVAHQDLPEGWVWTTIGELSEKISSGFPSGKHNQEGRGVPHLRPMNVSEKGEIDLGVLKYVEASEYEPLLKGDVLFNNTNSPALLGKTAYIRQDTNWAFSNHMTRVRPYSETTEAAWIANVLHYLFLTGYFKINCTNHVNQASINTNFLSKVRVPLPPLAEQRRIVEAIEQQLTRLDAGVASLRRAQAELRRYKAAVLKAACAGRLVPQGPGDEPADALLRRVLDERRAKWEAEQIARMQAQGRMILDDGWRAKYQEPLGPDTAGLPDLPQGWVWASLAQLSRDASYGTSQKCDYETDGMPVLRIPNIVGGQIDLSDLKFATVPLEIPHEGVLAPGDLLIVRTNGSKDLIGRGAVVRQALDRAYFYASYLIRFRLLPVDAMSDWIGTIWNAPAFRQRIEQSAATSAGQYNISLGPLSKMPIPLPPLAEQQRIVAEVERRLSVVAEVEAAVAANLKRAERLRQAILKRAFEGKLVPQDPSDEPASVLLERIRKEREGQGAVPKAGGGRPGRKRKGEQLRMDLS